MMGDRNDGMGLEVGVDYRTDHLLCFLIQTVHFSLISDMAFGHGICIVLWWRFCVLYLLLASSKSTTFPQLFFKTALARKNNCFCPWLSMSSSKVALRPPLESMAVQSLTAWRAAMMASSV